MRIIFFGSDPWMSTGVLDKLARANHEILLIVTKGDIYNNLQFSIYNFQVIQAKTTEDIKREKLQNLIRSDLVEQGQTFSGPDVIVLAAFGPPFLPEDILDWPKYGCLNVHASLLPRWRGASPVFAAIKNGDQETGVTIMKMTREVDRGSILGQKRIEIKQPNASLDSSTRRELLARNDGNHDFDNRETLTKKLGLLGGELIVETLKKLENDQIKFIDQPIKSPTPYTHRLTKQDGLIDWSKSPIETCPERSRRIERLIRAVTPWPGAWTEFVIASPAAGRGNLQPIILKILQAHLNNDKLIMDKIQLPGKNPISWKQFIAGHPKAELC